MFLSNTGRMVALRAMAAAAVCLALSGMPATATAPNVTFTATGTFATPAVSGADSLKLAGEPFTISIVANAASVPIKHGPNWAVFSPLKMTGTVHSALTGGSPVPIASAATSISQVVGPNFDLFTAGFPVKVVGISLTIRANITLPAGTLPNQLIHIFSAVALTTTTATVTYSDGANTTVLAVQTGTLAATIPATAAIKTAALPDHGVRFDDARQVAILAQRRRPGQV